MAKFRQKPVIIEAEKYRPGLEQAWVRFSGDGAQRVFPTEAEAKAPPVILANVHPAVQVRNSEGKLEWVEVREGDWIVEINGGRVLISTHQLDKNFERIDGYNGCLGQAVKALRYLAENDRPAGGEQLFNSIHLHQLADELTRCLNLEGQ